MSPYRSKRRGRATTPFDFVADTMVQGGRTAVVCFAIGCVLALGFAGCADVFIPDINLSGCLKPCKANLTACNDEAVACGHDCEGAGGRDAVSSCVSDCASLQIGCVDEAFGCVIACTEELERDIQ